MSNSQMGSTKRHTFLEKTFQTYDRKVGFQMIFAVLLLLEKSLIIISNEDISPRNKQKLSIYPIFRP